MTKTATAEVALLKIREAAATMDCSERHIWRLIKSGALAAFRRDGITRVSATEIKKYIKE